MLLELISKHPLATILYSQEDNELNGSCQVPLIYCSARELFIGHIANNNPLFLRQNKIVSLNFFGENAYLPPAFADNKILPSWLYTHAQISAHLHIEECDNSKDRMMSELINSFERSSNTGWQFSDVTPDQKGMLFQHISFIKLKPLTWQGNFKLSQNKSGAVRKKISDNLHNIGKEELAKYIAINNGR